MRSKVVLDSFRPDSMGPSQRLLSPRLQDLLERYQSRLCQQFQRSCPRETEAVQRLESLHQARKTAAFELMQRRHR